MAATKAQPRKAAKATATGRPPASASRSKAAVARTTELSDEVLKSVEAGQRAAIEAVHKFVDTVDQTLPHGEEPSRRQEILDSAVEMADRLVHTQYEFIRKVVDSAGKSLGKSGGEK
jgi:hypothetical protein